MNKNADQAARISATGSSSVTGPARAQVHPWAGASRTAGGSNSTTDDHSTLALQLFNGKGRQEVVRACGGYDEPSLALVRVPRLAIQ